MDLVSDKYLAITYEHGARGWDRGDCLNLPLLFYREEFGVDVTGTPGDYPEDWQHSDPALLVGLLPEFGFSSVDKHAVVYGDILVFMWKGAPSHFGVYLEQGKFLHTGAHGTGLSSLISPSWNNRLHSVWRLKDDNLNDC